MFKGQFSKYRGLIIANTLFVLFFLLYLLVNLAIQSQAMNALVYAQKTSELEKRLAQNETDGEVAILMRQLETGTSKSSTPGSRDSAPISSFLAPAPSPLNQIKESLAAGDLTSAQSSASQLNQQVLAKSTKQSALLKTLQIVAAILVFILYLLVLVPILRRLSQSDEEEVVSQKETEGIMNTVSEGLFLLGADHELGVEQSASLKHMFKLERDLEGNFFDFISNYVTQGNVQIAKDYIELLFGDRVKEKLVEDLNPLINVEINLIRRDGSYENRYLDFKFKRVVIDGTLSHLLGSVTDVTKQVLLEKQLIESKEEQEAQLDLLMSILHVENTQLHTFMNNADETLEHINSTLEARGHSNVEIRNKLTEISRDVHRLKGDAAALGLHNFEFSAHALEDEIENIKSTSESIDGKALIPTITKLRELFAELGRMKVLIDKFSTSLNNDSELASVPTLHLADGVNEDQAQLDELQLSMHRLVDTVASRSGVKANLDCTNLTLSAVPEHLTGTIQTVLTQFIRNSIVHGAEDEISRLAKGKSRAINITTQFLSNEDSYKLIIQDDGRGVNKDTVLARAMELNIVSPQQAENMERNEVIPLIFKSGFTNQHEADLDGGRGVGLDVVLALTKEHQGSISVQTSRDRFCRFTLSFPMLNTAAA